MLTTFHLMLIYGFAVNGPLAVYAMDQRSRGMDGYFAQQSYHWVVAFYSSAFSPNIITTR